MFNADAFLNSQFNQSLSTEYLLVPEGEYTAVTEPITSENFRQFDIKQGENAGQKGMALDVYWSIDNPDLKEKHGRTPRVKQGFMLDLTSNGTAIDFSKGRNVGLGRLRAALGQNETGRPWSFAMLGGQVAKVKVKHRVDKADSSKVYAEVSEVTRL